MRKTLLFMGLVLLLGACGGGGKPAMTPLEIQAMQTHDFEAPKDVVFASVVSVFQDLGYTIQDADKDTGLITAESPVKDTTGFLGALTGDNQMSMTRATAFVETIGNGRTRVRLNFVVKNRESSWYGQDRQNDQPILDPKVYQNAFERIDEAIFVRMGTRESKAGT